MIRTKAFLCIALFCLSFFSMQGATAQDVMRIAAVVNDDIITASDLAQRIRLTIATTRMPNTPETHNRLARTVLRTMIEERLKAQEGERLEIDVSDEQIKSGLAGFAQSIKVPADKLPQALAQIGVDIEVLKDQAEAEIMWGRVITSSGRDRIRVSDKEVTSALKEVEANKGKPEFLVSEIYIPIETPDQETAARELGERLIQHIRSGSPFDALARDFSQSPSAPQGGDLGWVQSGHLGNNIEAALNSLPSGSYSNPIRSSSGLHLYHLRDKRISGEDGRSDILTVSQAIFPLSKAMTADEINAKHGTATSLAQQAKSCDHFDELAKQYANPKSGRVANLALTKMPPALRNALQSVEKGQATVVQIEATVLALMVCEREKPAPIPEIAKRKQIKQRLRMEKIGRESRRIMQKLRRAAFVDVRL